LLPGTASLSVRVSGLNSDKGVLRYCVAPRGGSFPDCDAGRSVTGTVPIHELSARFTVTAIEPGDYAVAVFHDRNANSKLDTLIGIPREGYGFSNNPGFMARAPKFEESAIALEKATETEIRLRYIF